MAAILPIRVSNQGLVVGACLSVLLVAWFRPELPILLDIVWLDWGGVNIVNSRPSLASEWFFPLNASLTLICGVVFAQFNKNK